MKSHSQNKNFQYSSLVMGSKDVQTPFTNLKRPNNCLTAKIFSKKQQTHNNKNIKKKQNKIRGKSQRPDIYLQGQKVIHPSAWANLPDPFSLLYQRQRIRNSCPSPFQLRYNKFSSKTQERQVQIQQNILDYTQTNQVRLRSRLRSSFGQLKYSNKIHNQRINSVSDKKGNLSGQRGRDLRSKIQQKVQAKLNYKLQTTVDLKQNKKQLFYMSQKQLSGIKAESFIVSQFPSGQVITSYYCKKITQIASLTKIMTFFCILKLIQTYHINAKSIKITIDQKAAQISGTSAELYQGDQYLLIDLCYALMLPSGNDAAIALSRWGSTLLGQSKGFVSYMNKLGNQLGMKNSTFNNPHGLPNPNNGSTAEDVSILVFHCLSYQLFKQVVSTKRYRCFTINNGIKRQVIWENTNKLLRRARFSGVKTGVTVTAGPCLASLYNLQGQKKLIVILLRTSKLSRRFKETRWILGACLRRLGGHNLQNIRELLKDDAQLDSDNSEEQEQFRFDRTDGNQLERRRRIIINQL